MDWSAPIGPFVDTTWTDYVINHYERILALMAPWRGDPLTERHWTMALEVLDRQPEPTTIEDANGRWRQFVASIWNLILAAEKRQREANAARAARRR